MKLIIPLLWKSELECFAITLSNTPQCSNAGKWNDYMMMSKICEDFWYAKVTKPVGLSYEDVGARSRYLRQG